jgi:uncharacterized cupredoxin-like copper-binding protein
VHRCRLVYVLFLAMASSCAKRPAAPAANAVTITATDYAFAAPDTIVAGLTTFKLVNAGREPHQAVVAGATGKTFEELEAALLREGFPDWITLPGGPGNVIAGDSSIITTSLTPGDYLLLCFIPSPDGKPHSMKGMYRRFVVTPAPPGTLVAAEPNADITLRLSDYAFALSAPLTAGTHVIRVENHGPQLHEITLERLAPGKTVADFQNWAANGMRGSPPVEPAGGFAGPSNGKVGWLTVTLKPGNYLLNCYVPDAKDGKPHFTHGMVEQITVQ